MAHMKFRIINLKEFISNTDRSIEKLFLMNRDTYEEPFFKKYRIDDRWTIDDFHKKTFQRYPNAVALFSLGKRDINGLKFCLTYSEPRASGRKTFIKLGYIAFSGLIPKDQRSERREVLLEAHKFITETLPRKYPNLIFIIEIPTDSKTFRKILETVGFKAVSDREKLKKTLSIFDIGFIKDSFLNEKEGISYDSKRRHSGKPYVRQVCYIYRC